MHQFHHNCMMKYLSSQIDVYLVEVNKRRESHPNDTMSQVSKSLSNADAEDRVELNRLLLISKQLARVSPNCPICQMNLLHPVINVEGANDYSHSAMGGSL